jgi:carboxyl-terminal processing protease
VRNFKSSFALYALIFGVMTSLLAANADASNKQTQPSAQRKQLTQEDVKRFSAALSQIKNYYVKDIKDKKLFDDAIRGMLAGLDPHSAYLDAEHFKALTDTSQGTFGGLGIEVTLENGLLRVISPLEDSPADRAGIKAGDFIVRIDNKPTQELSLRGAIRLLRGNIGSPVKLDVLRKGQDKPLAFTIKRQIIKLRTVKTKIYDGHYGYIRISHFQAPTYQSLRDAIKKMQAQTKLAGLVIDLRNNPGGLLDSAIEISDIFIHNDNKGDEELIVFTKGRVEGSEFVALASAGDVMKNKPIVVLINGGSASAAEILAGALRDNKRALIVGNRSFGKGSVQTVIPLDNTSGIKLTTALYYTPSGHSIQAKGIIPDIEIAEIQIPRPTHEAVRGFSEADLPGHIKTQSQQKIGPEQKDNYSKSADLLYSDYQLHEAVNILKSLVLAKK